ncbi:MAG: hypothetical protein CVV42_00815 [Candidatus Riflebacteria bacterium HGW-Riflebacteria-2]|jgi:hypothetical protein|nr:MAG: hypothetical protein CVV42_00815 [Candidatus Riflebacteria bacterium HGW-Riflebacteria-2]
MKLLKLTLVTILALALLTGCGGGGGGGGGGIISDPTLAEQFPVLVQSYRAIEDSFLDDTLTSEQHTAAFMAYIDDPFYNLAGEEKRAHLESTTLDRFKTYKAKVYSLTTGSYEVADDGKTVKVRTTVKFHFQPTGAGGTDYGEITLGLSDDAPIVFTWRLVGDKWKISTGMPYLKSEMGY